MCQVVGGVVLFLLLFNGFCLAGKGGENTGLQQTSPRGYGAAPTESQNTNGFDNRQNFCDGDGDGVFSGVKFSGRRPDVNIPEGGNLFTRITAFCVRAGRRFFNRAGYQNVN